MSVNSRVSGAWVSQGNVVTEQVDDDYIATVTDSASVFLDVLVDVSVTETGDDTPYNTPPSETLTVTLF